MNKRDESPTRQPRVQDGLYPCVACWKITRQCFECKRTICTECLICLHYPGLTSLPETSLCLKCISTIYGYSEQKCSDCHDEIVRRRTRLCFYLEYELCLPYELCLLVVKSLPVFNLDFCGRCKTERCSLHRVICVMCNFEVCAACSDKCDGCKKNVCYACSKTCRECVSICCGNCKSIDDCFHCEDDICRSCMFQCEKCHLLLHRDHDGIDSCFKLHTWKHFREWMLYYFLLELGLPFLPLKRLSREFRFYPWTIEASV